MTSREASLREHIEQWVEENYPSSPDYAELLDEVSRALQAISVDYAIQSHMEASERQ